MPAETVDLSAATTATRRFNDFLAPLLKQGLTQAQIAAKAGIPPQYFSDIKRGKRPVTELIARRLGEEFNFDYRWLLGTSDTMEAAVQPSTTTAAGNTVWLPLFPFPIEGEPRQNPNWSGAGVEVSGAAAARVGLAESPYVLQFDHDDVEGRLQKGDLILISQAPNADAQIHVVGHGKKLFLARANEDGGWNRVANGKKTPSNYSVRGHCIGIVWSALV